MTTWPPAQAGPEGPWRVEFAPGVRLLIRDRDSRPVGYLRCTVCGERINGRHIIHHRKSAGAGPDTGRPSNGITVCGLDNKTGCHGRIHQHPAEARANGWIISRHLARGAGYDTPLLCAWRGWIVLDDEGGYKAA